MVSALRLCSCSRFCRFEFSAYERIRYNLFGNWSLHFICYDKKIGPASSCLDVSHLFGLGLQVFFFFLDFDFFFFFWVIDINILD